MARKDKKWLSAVAAIPYCVLCHSSDGLQVAHRNEGKGMGYKNPDCLTARLCMRCHHEIDNGKEFTREERRAMMDRAIVLTLEQLSKRGLVEVAA